MKKALCLLLSILLVGCLLVPAFAYSTAVIYDAETEPPHTITLDPNGGILPPGQETLTLERDGYVSALPIPTRQGFDFAGWFVDRACAVPFTDTTLVDRNMTLYAGWDAVSGGFGDGHFKPWHRPSGSTGGSIGDAGNSGSTGGQQVGSPKTGDAGIALYAVLAVLGGAGSAWTLAIRRREQH